MRFTISSSSLSSSCSNRTFSLLSLVTLSVSRPTCFCRLMRSVCMVDFSRPSASTCVCSLLTMYSCSASSCSSSCTLSLCSLVFSMLSASSFFCSLFTMYSCSASSWFSMCSFSRATFSSRFCRVLVRNSSSCSTSLARICFSFFSCSSRFMSLLVMNSSSCSTCLCTARFCSFVWRSSWMALLARLVSRTSWALASSSSALSASMVAIAPGRGLSLRRTERGAGETTPSTVRLRSRAVSQPGSSRWIEYSAAIEPRWSAAQCGGPIRKCLAGRSRD
mmetsp:Transcript_44772/g.114469  ORF Transcript_44772/g.114469 Transcript_44772/m.114469 type:complete len:277 (+) Transcript_44772:555-1385(+)